MKKQLFYLLTAFLLAYSLSGCSNNDDRSKAEGKEHTGSPLLSGITSDSYKQTCLIYSDTADAKKVGLVNYTTGEVIILDRDGKETVSCRYMSLF